MKKEILEKQRRELDALKRHPLIKRDVTNEAKKHMSSNLIKVILGPRRAGKSIFSLLLLENELFGYVNFDDERLLENFDADRLLVDIESIYGKTPYLFLDEIQNIPQWEIVVNRLQRMGHNLIITGSNANLLSKELATHLTGRHIPIELLPFNFNEYRKAKKLVGPHNTITELIESYTRYGGYPEVALQKAEPKEYLGNLFDSLLLKDVVLRHNIRKVDSIKRVGEYMISTTSQRFSFNSITRALNEKSDVTMGKYISYFSDAYITMPLSQYSHSPKKRSRGVQKAYVIDNGFIFSRSISASSDEGVYLENLVFTEFLKQGHKIHQTIFYYQTRNNKEVDFIIKNGNSFSLFQVSYDIKNPTTEKREVLALLEAKEELNADTMTIITRDTDKHIEKNGEVIQCVSLETWLSGLYKID